MNNKTMQEQWTVFAESLSDLHAAILEIASKFVEPLFSYIGYFLMISGFGLIIMIRVEHILINSHLTEMQSLVHYGLYWFMAIVFVASGAIALNWDI